MDVILPPTQWVVPGSTLILKVTDIRNTGNKVDIKVYTVDRSDPKTKDLIDGEPFIHLETVDASVSLTPAEGSPSGFIIT